MAKAEIKLDLGSLKEASELLRAAAEVVKIIPDWHAQERSRLERAVESFRKAIRSQFR